MEVSLSGGLALALAGALVVARTDPRPCGCLTGGRKDGHVHPELSDDDRRDHAIHAWNLCQQRVLFSVRQQPLIDTAVDGLNCPLDMVETIELDAEQETVVLFDAPLEREDQ